MAYSFPTTNIFYYSRTRLGVLKWLPTEEEGPILPANVRSEATIYSSCLGLVACRCNATSTYHVGNPFVRDTVGDMIRFRDLPAPPTRHLIRRTHVVLAADPFTPGFLVYCAFRGVDNVYRFQTYDSTFNRWDSVLRQLGGLDIVHNSGVSCRKTAYWLLSDSTGSPVTVLQFTGSIMKMIVLPLVPGPTRIQLGRAWSGIGPGLVAVIVSEAYHTVGLYALINERDAGLWHRFELFRVEVLTAGDGAANGEGWVATWRDRDRTLVCRELPWPIRFDGLRVELLFWVPGRVLLLANTMADPRGYGLTVLPGVWPASVADGVPHVSTAVLPQDL